MPNILNGIVWHPGGQAFYVAGGGVDDTLHVFALQAGAWREEGSPMALGHIAGRGLRVRPMATGVAANASGTQALVANFENDSVSVIDSARRAVVEKVAQSPYKDSALIFVVEDEAQNGADHVDAHRTLTYIVGPYVKQAQSCPRRIRPCIWCGPLKPS